MTGMGMSAPMGMGSGMGSALGTAMGTGMSTGMGAGMGSGMQAGIGSLLGGSSAASSGSALGAMMNGPALQALAQAYREMPTMNMGIGSLDPYASMLTPQSTFAINPALRYGYW